MSRIWDALKGAELHRANHPSAEGARSEAQPDRRSSERLSRRLPVLVYGHRTDNQPFHEATEALCTNAGGGLITLTIAVRFGQRLLLTNSLNQKEQECCVIYLGCRCKDRTAVGVGFSQPVPDFWDLPTDGD